jgi:hypothetical protein
MRSADEGSSAWKRTRTATFHHVTFHPLLENYEPTPWLWSLVGQIAELTAQRPKQGSTALNDIGPRD